MWVRACGSDYGECPSPRVTQRSWRGRSGGDFPSATWRRCSTSPPSALLSPVEELIRFGVVIERDAQLAFRHDIIRDAVRASVPVSARRALDRQAADVLLAAGATPVEVATQLAASAEPGDELAITTLLKAAEALAMSDPGAAADLSRRGVELAPRRHPLRGPLVAQTAVLLHEAARVEEARAFVDTSLREALPSEQEAEVRLSIAGMFAVSPDVRVDAGRQALALPDLPPPSALDTSRAWFTI